MMTPGGNSLSSAAGGDESRKKKKMAVIGVSGLILVAMVGAVAVGLSKNGRSSSSSPGDSSGSGDLRSSEKSIQFICRPTDYREQCVSSLSQVANNTSDPKALVKASFDVAIARVRDAMSHSAALQAAAKDPRTSEALEDCKELLDYAVDDLQRTIDRFGTLDLSKTQDEDPVDDLKSWLSAVITYQETCLDGFQNASGDAAKSMREALNSTGELTSNALAIVNEASSLLASFNVVSAGRRLLWSEARGGGGSAFPNWVTGGRRKLLASPPESIQPDVTVAQDGSGDYKTINEAVGAVPKNSNQTFVIYIKEGVYNEHVQVNRSMMNVMMYGDGANKTKITGNLNYIDGTPTFKTASFTAMGDRFMARDMGFENTAGPEKHQAVALRVQSDRSVFYRCRMDGYQDTLYAHTMRQFYRECTVSGTVDFVFGDAASVFQSCLFLVRRPMASQQAILTAQGRKDRHESTGIVVHNCTIAADAGYAAARGSSMAYLGRPWKAYSRTVIMQTRIDDLISPQGWMPWEGTVGLRTLYYAEFDNRGSGSDTARRVAWKGVRKMDLDRAHKYSVEVFIQGNQWLKATGVPYIPGLLPMSEPGRMH